MFEEYDVKQILFFLFNFSMESVFRPEKEEIYGFSSGRILIIFQVYETKR
jgi:hypothetical protein